MTTYEGMPMETMELHIPDSQKARLIRLAMAEVGLFPLITPEDKAMALLSVGNAFDGLSLEDCWALAHVAWLLNSQPDPEFPKQLLAHMEGER